jgi:hypothetical protein
LIEACLSVPSINYSLSESQKLEKASVVEDSFPKSPNVTLQDQQDNLGVDFQNVEEFASQLPTFDHDYCKVVSEVPASIDRVGMVRASCRLDQ